MIYSVAIDASINFITVIYSQIGTTYSLIECCPAMADYIIRKLVRMSGIITGVLLS